MGSDWLRRVTENDPERRKKALEFQSVVDKLLSLIHISEPTRLALISGRS